MRCTNVHLTSTNPMVNDYLTEFSRLEEFYTYNPNQPESFAVRYDRLIGQFRGDREVVTAVLKDFNQTIGAGPKTFHNIELLSGPDAAVVVTGQQAGILGGPLYTIYKAITAIQLAAKLTRELNKPVVPVFWIASEDHDFLEINHFNVWNREGEPVKLKLGFEPAGKISVGDIAVPPEVESLLAGLEAEIQDSEFKLANLQFLSASAQASNNLAEWFGRIICNWLGDSGLIFIDPMHSQLRKQERRIFGIALEKFSEINRSLRDAGEKLKAKGYPVMVDKEQDSVNLFVYHAGQRLALTSDGATYNTRDGVFSMSREEILRMAEETPESFSPNVMLRPLTQETILPTLAYVGGPGEISYWGQFKEIFQLFGMEMPIVFPRANLTVVEAGIENYLSKYDFSLEDVLYNAEGVKSRYLESLDQVGIERVFETLNADIARAYAGVGETLAMIDPSLKELTKDNQIRISSQVDWLKGKALQAHRKANETFIRQFKKICNSLAPEGKPQERYISGINFLVKYGPQFFQELAELDLISNTEHKVVYLKTT
ncbi:MAG TPA: bacillithiol biosynthesis cysteine-adding enzyme BshC [Verrucomicrobiae bacterium]|nr:bacillithiol biosynthesis cysteine-adding enzyme BshC [Verrucomicrobiae bacterium]